MAFTFTVYEYSKLSQANTIDELGDTKETIMDLMEQSGCDIPLKVQLCVCACACACV